MKRWFRWMRRKLRFGNGSVVGVLGIVSVVVGTDAATKTWLATPAWGWHQTSLSIATLIPVIGLLILCSPGAMRWPMVLAFGGAVGNVISAATPRGVANPFVADVTDGVGWGDGFAFTTAVFGHPQHAALAYNLADVCIVLGVLGTGVAGLGMLLAHFAAHGSEGWARR